MYLTTGLKDAGKAISTPKRKSTDLLVTGTKYTERYYLPHHTAQPRKSCSTAEAKQATLLWYDVKKCYILLGFNRHGATYCPNKPYRGAALGL